MYGATIVPRSLASVYNVLENVGICVGKYIGHKLCISFLFTTSVRNNIRSNKHLASHVGHGRRKNSPAPISVPIVCAVAELLQADGRTMRR
jgi:hypothetical protein